MIILVIIIDASSSAKRGIWGKTAFILVAGDEIETQQLN